MLTSQLGVRVLLWTGKSIPTPPSAAVMAAMQRIQVTNDADGNDGFQMTFALGRDNVADWDLLDGSLDPMTRVWIGAFVGLTPQLLIDGIITQQQVTPSNEPGASILTVTGSNVSVNLDLEEKNEEFPNQPDFLIATQVIASYPELGLVPLVAPTTEIPIEIQRITRQAETDLRFLQRLAERNGYVFYIEPLTFGLNNAYWGPATRVGLPLPALAVNMGDATNVKSLSFSNDALAAVSATGTFVEPITKVAIPVPPLPPLRVPPLAAFPALPNRKVLLRETANQNPAQAALSSASAATRAPEPVNGQGEVDTARYGGILRARGIVGVQGAGYQNDGNYYVRSVTHQIGRGSYTQSFRLSREGTGALLPLVLR